MPMILQRKPFAELVADPAAYKRVVQGIYNAIAASFRADRSRVTQAEAKRRFAICEKWFRTLRADKQWSIDRCLSDLPRALRAELDGIPYEPASRAIWIPQDGGP